MCNLNVVIKTNYPKKWGKIKKTIETVRLFSFMSGITAASYERNSEGDGIYLSGGEGLLVKSENKLDFERFAAEFGTSKFIITHQRIATSGREAKYTQPFDDGDFVCAHNGNMSSFVKGNHSDTYVFFKKFIKQFKKSRKKTRTKRIVKAIKKLLDKRDGWYSICIYDKVGKALYYFKNTYTGIHFYRTEEKDFLYICTDDDNKVFLKIFPHEFKDFEVKVGTIYKIVATDRVRVYPVGQITEKTYTQTGIQTEDDENNKSDPLEGLDVENFDNIDDVRNGEEYEEYLGNLEILQEIRREFGVFDTNNHGCCTFCGSLTYNMEKDSYRRVCDDCYMKLSNEILSEQKGGENGVGNASEILENLFHNSKKEKLNKPTGGGKNGV